MEGNFFKSANRVRPVAGEPFASDWSDWLVATELVSGLIECALELLLSAL